MKKHYSVAVNGENITFDSLEMRNQTIHVLKQTGRFRDTGYMNRPEYEFDYDESINDTCCHTDSGTGETVDSCEQCTMYGVHCGGLVLE